MTVRMKDKPSRRPAEHHGIGFHFHSIFTHNLVLDCCLTVMCTAVFVKQLEMFDKSLVHQFGLLFDGGW